MIRGQSKWTRWTGGHSVKIKDKSNLFWEFYRLEFFSLLQHGGGTDRQIANPGQDRTRQANGQETEIRRLKFKTTGVTWSAEETASNPLHPPHATGASQTEQRSSTRLEEAGSLNLESQNLFLDFNEAVRCPNGLSPAHPTNKSSTSRI